ncbi:MAG: hypothetical protein RL616_1430 [Verrucomicrobiota bacterium]|jgi:Na+-transporting methylmalonyl-CoA/oxaloacetate decarboxylase gamma subunit
MNLLAQLNAVCRRLARDESGVVFAFTVVVFLSLFVIACSVYGVGENIRQRIELQNAADAAAYSAGVVQADALSRVAAINKALAWTHVTMGRAVMDYDVDVWLEWTIKKFKERDQDVSMWVHQGNCPQYWVGYGSQGQVFINQSQMKSISTLENMWSGGSKRQKIKQTIDDSRKAIKDMNDMESKIVEKLKSHLEDVVQEVVSQNTGTPDANDFLYSIKAEDASGYFKTLDDEKRLLKFFDNPQTASQVFEDGVDVWFKLKNGNDGIQRDYEQQGSSLRAEWRWSGFRFQACNNNPCCVIQYYKGQVIGQDSDDIVTGEKAKNWGGHSQDYYETEKIKAQILTKDFFDRKGGIVVGVARKQANPLLFMLGNNSTPGMYGFFNPTATGGGTPYTWAAASSRAGYRDGGGDGEYWTKDSGNWIDGEKNLSQWDWDGELIPLPWLTDVQGVWNSSTWQKLDQKGAGGTSLGGQAGGSAPSGNFLH